MRRRLVALAAAGLLAGCSSGGGDPSDSPSPSPNTQTTTADPVAAVDWPTYHGNVARTGVSSTLLASDRLGVGPTVDLDEAVYASPIVANGMVIVATENNTVYALDGAYRQVWSRHLGTPSPADERPCGDIDPLGITGTPVYDAASKTVSLVAELSQPVRHQLVTLNAATGAVVRQTSLDFGGVDATVMQQRGALTITGGRVWVPFGALAGDCGNYKGRLVGVPLSGTGTPVVFTVPTARGAGLWNPSGPTVDAQGRLLVASANGAAFPGDAYDYSNSILALDTSGHIVDSFAPSDWAENNQGDVGIGSQPPTIVGPWVFAAGKSGPGYVLKLDDLGGIGGEVSQADVCESYGGTAVVNSTVYLPCTDGVRAVTISATGQQAISWHADDAITGAPIVGGGRVYSLDPDGTLYSLDQQTGKTRAQVDIDATSRFAAIAVRGSDLLVPTLNGLTVVRVG